MKRFVAQKAYLVCLVILTVFISNLAGCGGGGGGHWTEPTGIIVSLEVTPQTSTIPVSGTQLFTATAKFSDGLILDVTANLGTVWTSTDLSGGPNVATMSPNGVGGGIATGVNPGQATITAVYKGRTATATLTVTSGSGPAPSCSATGPLDLGSAASFGVLAGTALSITNPTTVNGDVGSPSITPAAGPSTLVGTMYDTSTGSLALIAAAVSHMQAAVDCANARTCDFNYAVATDFSTVGPLAPGVHCVTGAMSVGSNLNISTPGVYIFRSSGTLTSASSITVAFTGTANATNTSVFWVPTGTTSIGATNVFLGTIMGYNAAITLGANTTLVPGRVLSGAAVTLDTNTVTKPTP
jgi:hypothetical protein